LFDLVELWTFEPDVFSESVASDSLLHGWVFNSVRSSSDSFKLNPGHVQALHFISLELVLALWSIL
jgi:hypothetical protein